MPSADAVTPKTVAPTDSLPPWREALGYIRLPNGQFVRRRYRERGKAARREDKALRQAQRQGRVAEVLRILAARARRRSWILHRAFARGQEVE